VRKGETTERLEPKFYLPKYKENEDNIKKSEFPKYQFKQITALISDGTHFTPKYTEHGIKFLSVKDVRPFEIDYTHCKFISAEEADILDKRCRPQRNDILLTKVGTCGFASAVKSDERFQLFVSVALLRPNPSLILPDFFALCINSNLIYLQFERVVKGAGVPDLHLEDIRKIKIPVPPLQIQAEIVAMFESAYAQKRAKESEAKALLAGTDGYLLEKLGIHLPETTERKKFFYVRSGQLSGKRFDPFYHQNEFDELEKALRSGKYRIANFKDLITDLKNGVEIRNYADSGFRYLRVTDLDKHSISNANMRFVNVSEIPSKIRLNKNCILIARSGSLGLVSAVTDELLNCILSSHIFKTELNISLVKPEYLEFYFRSILGQKQFMRKNNGGVIPEISQSALKSVLIPIPPLAVQTEIAAHISETGAKAKQLEHDAKAITEQAKQNAENMILGQ